MVVISPYPHQKAFFYTKRLEKNERIHWFRVKKEPTIRIEKICSFKSARIRVDGTESKDGKFEARLMN